MKNIGARLLIQGLRRLHAAADSNRRHMARMCEGPGEGFILDRGLGPRVGFVALCVKFGYVRRRHTSDSYWTALRMRGHTTRLASWLR